MKKLKTLFCFAVATLLTGATAISNSNHNNNKNVMNQNAEKIEEVQKEGEEAIATTRTLRFHYHRNNDDYDGWNLWLWEVDKSGASYSFTSDGYGVYAESELNKIFGSTVTEFGFIIRKSVTGNDWADKEWYNYYDSENNKDNWTADNRYLTIPQSFENTIYDVYFYQTDPYAHYNNADDVAGTWYVQMMARNAIVKESTKAQLKYSFDVSTEGESTKYTFYNMKMNLGAIIPKTKIDDLEASRISIVEYGVALAKNTVLTKNNISITNAMIAKEKEARNNLTNGTTNNSYSYVNVVSKAYSGSDPERFYYTDSSGIAKEGDHVIFNANLSFDNEGQFRYSSVTAVAYFKFDIKIDSEDKVYELFTFLNPKNCSIPSLATEYVKSGVFSNFDQYVQGSLIALSEFKVD